MRFCRMTIEETRNTLMQMSRLDKGNRISLPVMKKDSQGFKDRYREKNGAAKRIRTFTGLSPTTTSTFWGVLGSSQPHWDRTMS